MIAVSTPSFANSFATSSATEGPPVQEVQIARRIVPPRQPASYISRANCLGVSDRPPTSMLFVPLMPCAITVTSLVFASEPFDRPVSG